MSALLAALATVILCIHYEVGFVAGAGFTLLAFALAPEDTTE
jgi:hypothetical protein